VLCAQQPPHRACPHCAAPLLTPAARDALIAQLEELRARTLAEEEEERCREEEALRLAEGAFPALGGPQHTPQQPLHGAAHGGGSAARGRGEGGAGAGAGHRVLLTDPRTNRVVVKSFVRLSRRAGHGEDELMEQEGAPEEGEAPLSRVLPPPREVVYVRVQRGPATRWVDLKGGAAGGGTAKYVAPLPGP